MFGRINDLFLFQFHPVLPAPFWALQPRESSLDGRKSTGLKIIHEPDSALSQFLPDIGILLQDLEIISHALLKTSHQTVSNSTIPTPRKENLLIDSSKHHPINLLRAFRKALLQSLADERVFEMRSPAVGVMNHEDIINLHEAIEGKDVVDGERHVAAYITEDDRAVCS